MIALGDLSRAIDVSDLCGKGGTQAAGHFSATAVQRDLHGLRGLSAGAGWTFQTFSDVTVEVPCSLGQQQPRHHRRGVRGLCVTPPVFRPPQARRVRVQATLVECSRRAQRLEVAGVFVELVARWWPGGECLKTGILSP